MTLEEQLINKTYFEKTFMNDTETNHPIQVLGEAYLAEQMNDMSDLSYIRFAQGEVYFHNKDFEAAIFKWENIDNELEPWARKNMADAYFELGIVASAEEIYNSISTDSTTLTTEVSLKLFAIYIEQGRLDQAVDIIKEVISYNPDYPDVTEMARVFFEDHQDWSNAVELTVNEALRTDSAKWFDVLQNYIDIGKTKKFPPHYFSQVIVSLYIHDQVRFEEVVASFWNSYKDEDYYLTWLKEMNRLFLNIEENDSDIWRRLPQKYLETYSELISGHYLVNELNEIIPNHLTNWLKVADQKQSIFASTAVLAWSEIFPTSISSSVIQKAENLILNSRNNVDVLEDSLALFETIVNWAKNHDVNVGNQFNWIIRELMDLRVHHLFIAGTSEHEKSSFIKTVLGDSVGEPASVVMYKDHDDIDIREITDTEVIHYSNLFEYYDQLESGNQKTNRVIDFKLPTSFLHENDITFIDAPIFNHDVNDTNDMLPYLHVADALLFVLNENEPFNDHEAEVLHKIQKYAPNLRIHFLFKRLDSFNENRDSSATFDETMTSITTYFPNAEILPYSLNNLLLTDLSGLIKMSLMNQNLEEERGAKLLFFIRKLITNLLEQRLKLESDLGKSIEWNEQMVTKLNGAIHQLDDVKKEKTSRITKSFASIKDEIKMDLKTSIPKLIKDCSDLITEESDFRKIHLDLNEEMNFRIENYLKHTALPKFSGSIQNWIALSTDEFNESKSYLEEMSEGFNTLFGVEKIQLDCDYKVLDDWRRDAERMKNGIQIEKVNILLRHTPSQVLLKSAGKLFGSIPQNKSILYNRYKKFIENENYQNVVDTIASKFLMQFELFEKALERDIAMFFQNPLNVLEQTVRETENEIKRGKDTFQKLKANPEMYRDPLTLFEVRLRQFEWMMDASRESTTVY